MSEAAERTVKSTQEQAVASWIMFLNQRRLEILIDRLNQQDINLEESLNELNEIKKFIEDAEHILGNASTKHGEIAEVMQVRIANARRLIKGLARNHSFEGVGRTAPEDYMRNGKQVQSKFYNGLRNTLFGKHALAEHLEKYRDFTKNGGSYDIPKDQYEEMVDLLNKYHTDPKQLSRSEYNLAKKMDEFLKSKGLELGKDIKPSVVNYSDVQQGNANKTVEKEEENIKKEDEKQRKKAYEESKPSLQEGLKATAVSAAVEGGVSFCMSVVKKRKEKSFSEFSEEDWKEIGLDAGKGAVKGGIRGGTLYVATNFTATPANVASAYITAAFGIAAQIQALNEGKVSSEDFVINCETVCLDVTVSAIASLAGQVLIPIPVLGAVIGNVAGQFIYEHCKKQNALKAQQIIKGYNAEMQKLNQQLDLQYTRVLVEIQKAFQRFKDLEQLAFDENVNIAFQGSISLASEVGVADEQILRTKQDIDNFFII